MVNHVNLPFFCGFPVLESLITPKARNMNSTGPKTLVLGFGTHNLYGNLNLTLILNHGTITLTLNL